ncbi:hypothetical protein PIB30_085473 [Stylosanthes scabra]|uniref:Uncharacterized protein n=1 Tax=Stylosanthes scabra TaxID=79078 RepID=A0ABU6RU38_9FABA|nr:hypothetical protein [Stylosanthes scabra]
MLSLLVAPPSVSEILTEACPSIATAHSSSPHLFPPPSDQRIFSPLQSPSSCRLSLRGVRLTTVPSSRLSLEAPASPPSSVSALSARPSVKGKKRKPPMPPQCKTIANSAHFS